MDKVGDAIDDAGDAISDQATDMGNSIEDICDKAKEGANAEDTDCKSLHFITLPRSRIDFWAK